MNGYLIIGIIISIYGLWIAYSSYKKSKKESKKTLYINAQVSSERLKNIFYKIANRITKHTVLCDIYSWFSIVVGYSVIPLISILLLLEIPKMSTNKNIIMEPILFIPEVTIHLTIGLLIAIIIGVIAHEMSHGIIAIRNGINIKEVGILYLFLPLGAYVNPDEDEYNESKALSKLKMVAVGPTANLLLALVFMIILSKVYFTVDSMILSAVSVQSPLHGVIPIGSIIQSVNGININPNNMLTLFNYAPSHIMTITTSHGVFTAQRGTMELMGLIITPKFSLFGDIVFWGFLINLSFGIVNLAPIYFFDGGHMIAIPFERFRYIKSIIPIILGGLVTSAFVSLIVFSIFGNRMASLFLFKIGVGIIILAVLWDTVGIKIKDSLMYRYENIGKNKVRMIKVGCFIIGVIVILKTCYEVIYGVTVNYQSLYEVISIGDIVLLAVGILPIGLLAEIEMEEETKETMDKLYQGKISFEDAMKTLKKTEEELQEMIDNYKYMPTKEPLEF